MLQHTTT